MRNVQKMGIALIGVFLVTGIAAAAEPGHDQDQGHGQQQGHDHPPPAHAAMHGPVHRPPQGEPHPGPSGYSRVTEPKGWNTRPAAVDRAAYQHNFRAARSFHVGPYHRPSGWVAHSWAFGQVLPRAYWTSQYILADYWLFALEVPPAGYEWVRDGSDALLINVDSGEILQVEYGVFA